MKCAYATIFKPGRHYASRQLSASTAVAVRATKIVSIAGVDIPVDRSFPS